MIRTGSLTFAMAACALMLYPSVVGAAVQGEATAAETTTPAQSAHSTPVREGFLMSTRQLIPHLHILSGAVKTGVLVSGDNALLIDCCDTVTFERLAELGVRKVEMILCTQHRRPNVAGAYPFVANGAELVVPKTEQYLFDEVDAYWADWKNRWHLYHNQPGPQVLTAPIRVGRAVGEGDTIEWRGTTIRVLDTPGATDGSVSYRLEVDGQTVCFCGDALCGPGQLWDLHSLQKGFDCIGDYHGFIGNRRKLIPSLEKLGACGAGMLVPSHGDPIEDPAAATTLLLERLDLLWRNFTAISCLNHYFPSLFDDTKDDPLRMKPAQTHEPPPWVRRVDFTSFAVVSDGGAALLIDCGHDSVVAKLQEWMRDKVITSVDGCWVTHYHDDHVDGLPRVVTAFRCPVMTDRHVAEIIEHPMRFVLPCISPNAAPVAKATSEGETWDWREFKLTAFHFPGQTYYHSGLLVEGHGKKVFFAGDSGSPTGVDDHCCGNRNFFREGRGFRRCIEIWREYKPDYIFNQHQSLAFTFTDDELDYMDHMIAERERLVGEMVPWGDPNFALDEWWVRAYPYEQETSPGGRVCVEIHFTNHDPRKGRGEVEPVLPEGWRWEIERGNNAVEVNPRTDGAVDNFCANPDGRARVWLAVPEEAAPGRYPIPFRIWWDDRYLGQFRHAIVDIR